MSLRLTRPGMRSASLAGKIHPKTGEPLQPIGYLNDGTAVWPQMGAAPDDDSDSDPRGALDGDDDEDDESEDDEDEDDEDEEEEDDKPKGKKGKKSSKDDDDEDEGTAKSRASRQAAKYRTERNAARIENAALNERLRKLENKGKKPEEVAAEELAETKVKADKLAERQAKLTLENAFLRSNVVDWIDPEDALRLVDLSDVDVDEDGTVDRKALRAALKELARRKPHLVKKPKVAPGDDDDDEDEDDEPRSRTPKMNGKRKGSRKTADRAALAKDFPVLGRR